MRSMDLVHTFGVMGNERRLFSPCGSLRIKPLGEMRFLCIFFALRIHRCSLSIWRRRLAVRQVGQ